MKPDYLQKGIREAGLTLTVEQAEALLVFADELKRWNKKINLTAITDDEEIAAKHLVDALFFSSFLGSCKRVLDIGSGAGIPALPLKIVRDDIAVVSVDAVAKKIHFQRHVARTLKLIGFEAVHSRVEQLGPMYNHSFDVITSRAFSSLELFVTLAAPLLSEGGRIIAMKGPAVASELRDENQTMLADLGFEIHDVRAYSLPFNRGKRSLVVITPLKPA